MDFKPIQQQKIYEQIVGQIRTMITEGILKPGDKLPSERVLADTLKVSRASVREALSALHLLGVVEVKSGEGAFIKQNDVSSVIRLLSFLLPTDQETVSEIAQVRKGLEVEAAGLAALNATEKDLLTLESIINKMKEELETSSTGEISDWDFHYNLAKATGNSVFVKIMDSISDAMQKTIYINRGKLFTRERNQEILYRQHSDIFNAVKNRDTELARKMMYEHLRYAEEEIKSISV